MGFYVTHEEGGEWFMTTEAAALQGLLSGRFPIVAFGHLVFDTILAKAGYSPLRWFDFETYQAEHKIWLRELPESVF
jgi:hypothetical protein